MQEPLLNIELPGFTKLKSGKVREIFDLGDAFLFVATDRISAFDCVMPNGIPRKGEVLTQTSLFWFDKLRDLAANHLLTADVARYPERFRPHRDVLQGRSMLVRRARMIPVECV